MEKNKALYRQSMGKETPNTSRSEISPFEFISVFLRSQDRGFNAPDKKGKKG